MLYTVSAGDSAADDAVPNADSAPPPVGDPARPQVLAVTGEHDEREVTGPSRVRPVPGGDVHLVRVEGLHVGQRAALAASGAAEQVRLDTVQPRGEARVLGVGDHPGGAAEPRLGGRVAVRAQQHRDGAEPAQRDDQRERGRPGAHQHADRLTAPHPDVDQAADDGVDAVLGGRVRVRAAPVEEEDLVGPAGGLLVQ